MWGTQKPVDVSDLINVRLITTSTNGNQIVYSRGNKPINPDDFKVSIIENDLAYGMKDEDYFNKIIEFNTPEFSNTIWTAIKTFARKIDNLSNTYKTFNLDQELVGGDFNITPQGETTFGYNTNIITTEVENFRNWFNQIEFTRDANELEEALIIIFLAMISEWYYHGRTGNKSKWQHRIKMIGLHQILFEGYSAFDTSVWSKNPSHFPLFPKLCRRMKVYDKPFVLR